MTAGDDVALLEAWCAGDRTAGDALVGRYFAPIRRFFASKIAPAEVEDLVQGTFLDCVERRGAITLANGFRAYLYAIARNRLCDHLRARYRSAEVVDPLSLSIADHKTSPTGRLARAEEERMLAAALHTIPLAHQIAIELAYWEDLSGREIATVLGITENTVRSRMARAREALREALATLAPPDVATTTLSAVDTRLHALAG